MQVSKIEVLLFISKNNNCDDVDGLNNMFCGMWKCFLGRYKDGGETSHIRVRNILI